jgi:hypothetical protein
MAQKFWQKTRWKRILVFRVLEEDCKQARKWSLCTSQTRQEDNKTREKGFIQTIRHKDIFVYRDTETWVVLSFVALNPIVNLAETGTHSIILFALCMPLINL